MFIPEMRALQADKTTFLKYLKFCHIEDGAELFRIDLKVRTRNNGSE